jgi:hypothetical protein
MLQSAEPELGRIDPSRLYESFVRLLEAGCTAFSAGGVARLIQESAERRLVAKKLIRVGPDP